MRKKLLLVGLILLSLMLGLGFAEEVAPQTGDAVIVETLSDGDVAANPEDRSEAASENAVEVTDTYTYAPDLLLQDEGRQVVLYMPTTQSEKTLNTAKMVEALIRNRFGTDELYQVGNTDKKGDKVFGKNNSKTAAKLKNAQTNDLTLSTQDTTIWFLIPTESDFTRNGTDLNTTLDNILANTHNSINFILIGEKNVDFVSDYVVNHPEKTKVYRICSDASVQTVSEDGAIPLFRFAATLYGKAVSIQVNEDGSFTLPVSGDFFVIANAPSLSVEKDGVIIADESFSENNMSCLFVKSRMQETYSAVADNAESIHVYYYPDLAQLSPVLNAGDDSWIHMENQEISVTLGEDFGRKTNMEIQLSLSVDGNNDTVTLNAENNYTYALNTTEATEVTVSATLTWLDTDGSLICQWKSAPVQRTVVFAEIHAKKNEKVQLYYDSEDELSGEKAFLWSDLFDYNAFDKPKFFVNGQNLSEERAQTGYTVKTNEAGDGFILTVSSGCLENFQIEFTAQNGEGPVVSNTLSIVTADFSSVFAENAIVCSDTVAEQKAGATLAGTVTISGETMEKWNLASETVKHLPKPEKLLLSASFGKANADSQPGESPATAEAADETASDASDSDACFTKQNDGSYQAEWQCTIPENANQDEAYSLKLSIKLGDRILKEETHEFVSQNGAPALKGGSSSAERAVLLQGMPNALQPSENILADLLSENKPCSLFEDAETPENLTCVITFSNPETLEIKKNGEIVDPIENKLEVLGTDTVEVTVKALSNIWNQQKESITFKASDGVNESEPFTLTYTVKSHILHIASFAALGLGSALLLLVIILIIHQARKPSFADTVVRCVSSETSAKELLQDARTVSLSRFGKKGLKLSELLIVTHQPPISEEAYGIASQIELLPGKENAIRMKCSAAALKELNMTNAEAKSAHPADETLTIHFCDVTVSILTSENQEDYQL